MATEITIAAVGDLLMKKKVIAAARRAGGGKRYVFDGMFSGVAPILRKADLTIGNLETTFAGRHALSGMSEATETKHPKTGSPRFNCPASLAGTLKRVGFDVLTTANNHCLDYGLRGLTRTLNVLDSHGIAHTGTARTASEAGKLLVKKVKGIKIGIAAYTMSTNSLTVPGSKKWAVNKIAFPKIASDLRRLRKAADVTIVCIHFGKEFQMEPNSKQKSIVRKLFALGADVVLGAHPHVLQRHSFRRRVGSIRYVIYSMGNFIGSKLRESDHTRCGVIVKLIVRKSANGTVIVAKVRAIPTWISIPMRGGKPEYRIGTLRSAMAGSEYGPSMQRVRRRAFKLFGL